MNINVKENKEWSAEEEAIQGHLYQLKDGTICMASRIDRGDKLLLIGLEDGNRYYDPEDEVFGGEVWIDVTDKYELRDVEND